MADVTPPPGATRRPAVEVFSQMLGSGVLAGTMRAPLGTTVLVGFMGEYGTAHTAVRRARLKLPTPTPRRACAPGKTRPVRPDATA